MEPAEVWQAIHERMSEIKRKKIWERTLKIVETLGKVHHEMYDCYTHTEGNFSIEHNGLKLNIILDDDGQFAEDATLEVFVNSIRVFDARETSFPENKEQTRLIKRKNKSPILVKLYHPGEWTELLNVNKLRKIIKRQENKNGRKTKKPDPNRLLNSEELIFAKNLGIN